MADILLLAPRYRGRPLNHMPHGLLAVGAVLKMKGHNVQIVDSHVQKYSPYQVLQKINTLNFDIVGITGISTSYYFWKEFVPLFRKKYGNSIPIMAGGSVASTMPETFLKFIDVDAIATGDAEPIVAELTSRLLERKKLDDLNGIGYRKVSELVIKPALRVKDMDSEVPIPAYDLINVDDYRSRHKSRLEFVLFSSRGCPYNCFFCSRNFGRQFIQHSVDKFIKHMVFVAEKYSPDLFCIADELMTTRRNWIIEFCTKYKASGLDMRYRINSRVDSVDRELLKVLKSSQCYEINFGIESGSPLLLKEMNKGVSVEQNRKAIQWCNEVGIHTSLPMVFGMPSETIDTIKETKGFLIKEDVKTIGNFYATAYPGSALFDYALSNGYIKDIDEYMTKVDNASRLIINYSALGDKTLQNEIAKLNRDIEYAWYKKRRMILGMLRLKLQLDRLDNYRKISIDILRMEGLIGLMRKIVKKLIGQISL